MSDSRDVIFLGHTGLKCLTYDKSTGYTIIDLGAGRRLELTESEREQLHDALEVVDRESDAYFKRRMEVTDAVLATWPADVGRT